MNPISSDDFEDANEMIDDLDDWIEERKERCNAAQMALMLSYKAAFIAYSNVPDENKADTILLEGLKMGKMQCFFGDD